MYHLLVKFDGWADHRDQIALDRVFEQMFSDPTLRPSAPDGSVDLAHLPGGPALLVSEERGTGPAIGRVGVIRSARQVGRRVQIEYELDTALPAIPIPSIAAISTELGIQPHELGHTHWALKSVDLLRVLLAQSARLPPRPSVFRADEPVEGDLISVMMPFALEFAEVYASIGEVAERLRLRCQRADDIWVHDTVIQDIVSLICRSRVVIADCSRKNPNVFYEIGIAHSLGRDVILITQSGDDIPFDLRHLRYLTYLNNGEGRERLVVALQERLATIRSR